MWKTHFFLHFSCFYGWMLQKNSIYGHFTCWLVYWHFCTRAQNGATWHEITLGWKVWPSSRPMPSLLLFPHATQTWRPVRHGVDISQGLLALSRSSTFFCHPIIARDMALFACWLFFRCSCPHGFILFQEGMLIVGSFFVGIARFTGCGRAASFGEGTLGFGGGVLEKNMWSIEVL